MKNEPFLSFVAGVAALREAYRVESGYSHVTAYGAEFEIAKGAKFARVLSTETRRDGSKGTQLHCFVVLEDNTTRTLGELKKGDIMKPASWKAPAKHARGNIFAPDNGLGCVNHYGPEYLR